MANGDSFWKDMPWWVKAIAIVGVPSVLSLYIVYSDRAHLLAKMDVEAAILRQLSTASQLHAELDRTFDMELQHQAAETNRILLATCINATLGRNDRAAESRDRCYGASK